MSNLADAIQTWDEQTSLVLAAPFIHMENLPVIKKMLKEQRAMVALMPFSDDERALVMAALERFEVALFSKIGD
jgi:hypothetical protein